MPPEFADACNAAEQLLGRNLTPERRARVAFIDHAGPWTYAALADRCARFAGALAARGVPPEHRVALCLDDTIDFPTAFLGAMQHGAVPIPLNTRLTAKDYAYILADSRARALVVSAGLWPVFAPLLDALPHLEHVFVSTGSGGLVPGQLDLADALAEAKPAEGFAATRAGDMAFWLYTSGTTGRPKGAVHAHSHLVATADLYAIPVLALKADDVVFSAAKLFFAYGLGNGLTFPMAVGATTVLLEGRPTAAAVCDVLARHRPTVFYGVPTLYGMLLAADGGLPAPGASSLRICTSAGEPLPAALLDRWRRRTGLDILDGIGSTEALHIYISNRIGEVRPGTTGRVVEGYDVRLVDDAGRPVPDGELGHLEVGGPTTAMMYWNQRERTKATFRGHWMRTGDMYRRDADGYYTYGGRGDDLMKVGGIWVSPFEVEDALLEHPAVLECGVIAHPDHDGLDKPKAFVMLRAGAVADEALGAALIAFVRARLASYKRPRWVTFVDALPRTATGKLQRFKLRDG